MNRVIILDGPDGGGKTTLANTLATEHGFKVIHTGPPMESCAHDLFNTYLMDLWLALHEDQPVVFDRLYLGETIYGPIMRGKSLLTDHHRRMLDRVVRAYDVKHVLCLPPRPVALMNWRAKKQDYIDHEHKWNHVFEAYDRWSDRLMVYDYTATFEDGIDATELFIPRPTLPEGMVGSPKARVLLVGERVNTRVQELDLPFMDDSGSSAYLNEALQEAGLVEEDLAFCNAYDIHGVANRFDRWSMRFRYRPLPQVIALGNAAAEVLKEQGIPHHKIPHPQYVKRFNHGGLQEYARQLKEAAAVTV